MPASSLELLTKALSIANISVHLIAGDPAGLCQMDNRLRAMLFENFSYAEAYDFLDRRVPADTLVRMRDEFDLLYLFLRIPTDSDEVSVAGHLVSIGPFQTMQHDRDSVLAIINRARLPGRLLPDLCEYYNTVPVISEVDSLECLVLYLASGLFQRQYHPACFPDTGNALPPIQAKEFVVRKDPQIARASVDQRYSEENALLLAIASGDYEKAMACHTKLIRYHIRARADTPLEDQRHRMVIMNSLCRKTVELAGVHPLYIDELSTHFATEINRIGNPEGLDALMSDMIREYCFLVKNHAMKGYSDVTRQIVSYIDFHYTEELSLRYFAKMFNLSRTYLSDLFRKETGSTLTDFIHQVRLRHAIVLLNSSTLSVTAIATSCGYNDVNYFIRRFKKAYGLSPRQYQNTLHPSATRRGTGQ